MAYSDYYWVGGPPNLYIGHSPLQKLLPQWVIGVIRNPPNKAPFRTVNGLGGLPNLYIRLGPHPLTVTTRGNGDYIRVLVYNVSVEGPNLTYTPQPPRNQLQCQAPEAAVSKRLRYESTGGALQAICYNFFFFLSPLFPPACRSEGTYRATRFRV